MAECNAETRLIRWQSGDTVITMLFDRMGRRVEMRTVKDGAETLQRFVYDNYLCVQQLRGADNTLFQSYVWDPTEPIATRPLVFLPASGETAYYFHDGNKNVSDLVDTQGSVVHYDYAPFGASTTSTLSINPFQFSSEYADDNLHLVYYNYRHYNAETGKWITREPFDEDEAFGLYNMLKNGVASKSDWLGLLFYYYKTINENYSSLPGGVRALTHVQETVATQCSSTYKLSIIITIAVEIRLLKPTHAAWKTRYRRYNMLWGNPRTNESERKAALTHEQDHVQVIETEMKALRSLNTSDGRQYTTMCECEEKEREIEAFVEKYDEKVEKLLKRQDKYPYNQGGINVYE